MSAKELINKCIGCANCIAKRDKILDEMISEPIEKHIVCNHNDKCGLCQKNKKINIKCDQCKKQMCLECCSNSLHCANGCGILFCQSCNLYECEKCKLEYCTICFHDTEHKDIHCGIHCIRCSGINNPNNEHNCAICVLESESEELQEGYWDLILENIGLKIGLIKDDKIFLIKYDVLEIEDKIIIEDKTSDIINLLKNVWNVETDEEIRNKISSINIEHINIMDRLDKLDKFIAYSFDPSIRTDNSVRSNTKETILDANGNDVNEQETNFQKTLNDMKYIREEVDCKDCEACRIKDLSARDDFMIKFAEEFAESYVNNKKDALLKIKLCKQHIG